MQDHKIVSQPEWIAARKEFLEKEKVFTRQRDQLSRERRELPWVKVESKYLFSGPDGEESLTNLFDGRSQLIVYHFMYGPQWQEGCPSCSYWADNFNGTISHLNHRDISMVAISRAPLDALQGYQQRMGWEFKWLSSIGSDFNFDYNVSFTAEEMEKGEMVYNYHICKFPSEEGPGVSVFYRNDQGEIFHTYSCFARGLDMLNGAYHYMDIAPKGRDEDDLSFTMAWLRRHDQYDD